MHWRDVVVSLPDVCGGHPILKGHRIEVHSLVHGLREAPPERWPNTVGASEWLTPEEAIVAAEFCADRLCRDLDSYCCNCSMNKNPLPPSDPDHGTETDGWQHATEALIRLGLRDS